MTRDTDKPQGAALQWHSEDQASSLDPAAVFAAGLRNHNIANTAYPIAHRRTIWQYRQEPERHESLLTQAFACAPGMGLYVHVPFCQARCRYCEYVVVDHHTPEQEEAYFKALFAELDRYRDVVHGKSLVGLDIGGGTPALVDPGHVERIVRYVDEHFERAPGFSISIETTPRIAAAHPERLAIYRAAGIDRISMGIQTVSRQLLERYDRDHGRVRHNQAAADNIRQAGFGRFNVDAMYGFAHQTTEDLLATLEHIFSLDPEYITLYRMRYKGTRVSHEAADVRLQKVNEMYEVAFERLAAQGYSENYGKNGFSRVAGDPGTSAYLTSRVVEGVAYLGVGLGAQTFTNNLLAYNLGAADKKFKRYLAATDQGRLPIQDLYHLPPSEAMAKMISVAFYFGEIDCAAFEHRFGVALQERFADQVAFVVDNELMRFTDSPTTPKLRLTKKGARHLGGVVAQFYSPAVQQVTGGAVVMSNYRFANVLLSGPCNLRCPTCIGRLLSETWPSNLDRFPLLGLDRFVATLREHGVVQVSVTGTNTEPLLHRHTAALTDTLRREVPGVQLSLHTNGIVAVERSSIPIKVSTLVTAHNYDEIPALLQRFGELGLSRAVLRRCVGGKVRWPLLTEHTPVRWFGGNPVYEIDGLEVSIWDFSATSLDCVNLYSDGRIADSYRLRSAANGVAS